MIDMERLARALASTQGDQAAVESVYEPGTSWLDVPEEWFETPRELAAQIAAAYEDAEPSDSLDAAWAEAEAALPEGWGVQIIPGQPEGWEATQIRDVPNRRYPRSGNGPTPAAALRALAAKLREVGR